MDYPICLNPSCKSHGKSHPNCHCYDQQQLMAEGGEVEHFCATDNPHKEGCQYFAEGGESIPIEQFQAAQDTTPPSDPDSIPIDQFKSHEDVYGTPGQVLKTVGEGLGTAIGGPAFTAAEKLAGVNPEDVEQRAQENPVAHAIGTGAGLVGSAAAGTEFTQLGALGKIGSLAGEGAEALGASKTVATATKLGLESALYSLGDETSKLINENPDSIQTAAMHVGLSGILGAGVGAGLGKLSNLWLAKMGPKAEEFAKGFTGSLKSVPDEASPFVQGPFNNFPPPPGSPLFSDAAASVEPSTAEKWGSKSSRLYY